ncbi:MAG TPA: hypothetical protein VIV12_23275 [Streptosporangiaceae bacterium]
MNPDNGARRCSVCNINYPNSNDHAVCHNCGEDTKFMIVPVHEDWVDRARRVKAVIDDRTKVDDTPLPAISARLQIVSENGKFFVTQTALINAGLHIQSHRAMVLFIANGIVWETQGWDEPNRRWLIEPVLNAYKLNEPIEDVEPGDWVDELIEKSRS